MVHFGLGFASAIPSGANPTPIPFAHLTGLTINTKPSYKKFQANSVYTKFAGLTSIEVTGKIDMLNAHSAHLQLANPGATVAAAAAGSPIAIPVMAEQKTVTTGAATANNTTGFVDYGVWNASDGIAMQRVASAPTAGQYTVTTGGVFGFHTGDNGKLVLLNYTYTSTTVGRVASVSQSTVGLVNGIQLVGYMPSNNGKPLGFRLYSAVFDDFTLTGKNDDFTAVSLSFFGMEDPATTKVWDYWFGD